MQDYSCTVVHSRPKDHIVALSQKTKLTGDVHMPAYMFTPDQLQCSGKPS